MPDISERSFEQAIEVALLAAPAEAGDSAGDYRSAFQRTTTAPCA